MSPSAEHDWASPDVLDAVTLVQGLSPSEAAELLQVVPAAASLSFEQLDVQGPVLRDGRWMQQVQIDVLGGWLVLTAAAGPAGRELWPELSAGGALLRISQTINAHMEFLYARMGHEVRRFDPLLWPDEQWGQPLPGEADLVFGDPERDPFEQAVLLVEALTGLALTSHWLLRTPHPTFYAPTFGG